jgi:hypothetical protein
MVKNKKYYQAFYNVIEEVVKQEYDGNKHLFLFADKIELRGC